MITDTERSSPTPFSSRSSNEVDHGSVPTTNYLVKVFTYLTIDPDQSKGRTRDPTEGTPEGFNLFSPSRGLYLFLNLRPTLHDYH